MTAREHAQAIAKACGVSLLNFACLDDHILVAVKAAMQDARNKERGQIIGWLGTENVSPARLKVSGQIAAHAHKGAGDE